MAEQTDSKVPDIRFRGFKGDWEEKLLGEILTERSILQKISADAPILAFASGQGVIPRSERKSNNRDHLTLDQANKFYKLTEYDDLVYNPSNLKYGAIDRNKHGRGVISPIYVTFTTEEDPSFIEPIIKSEKFKLRALLFEEGTVVKRQSVKPENLLSLDVSISNTPKEQSKIGTYFKELDRLIGLYQRKHDKLVTLKQAMLQKMFPKEGDSTPEVRFKSFSGVWKEKKLSDVGEFNPESELPEFFEYVDLESVSGTTLIAHRRESKQSAPSRAQRLARQGDLFYQTVRPYQRNNYLFSFPASNFVFSTGYAQIRPYEDGDFLLCSVQQERFVKAVLRNCTGTSYPAIKSADLAKLCIFIPDPDEQQKIGSYFRNLDELISKHSTQLKKLKQIKSACLEKMFA